ncbi:NAD-dependent epimerase/dehydratase family protein [Lacisediminihabitans sp. FW035]
MQRFLVTGGNGRIATAIRPALASAGHALRLLDILPLAVPATGAEESVTASVTDLDALEAACAGVDLVIHLGGYASERSWSEIVETNINGTQAVLEAARRAGVPRVLIASSIHAVGYATAAEARVAEVLAPRPDTYYGVGKVAAEALASLYGDRIGMSVVSARIANFVDRPVHGRGLSLWFSPADMVRLVEACAALTEPGHSIVWGVSNNSRRWVRLDAGRRIGFVPVDDAEQFASQIDQKEERSLDAILLAGGFVEADQELGVAPL